MKRKAARSTCPLKPWSRLSSLLPPRSSFLQPSDSSHGAPFFPCARALRLPAPRSPGSLFFQALGFSAATSQACPAPRSPSPAATAAYCVPVHRRSLRPGMGLPRRRARFFLCSARPNRISLHPAHMAAGRVPPVLLCAMLSLPMALCSSHGELVGDAPAPAAPPRMPPRCSTPSRGPFSAHSSGHGFLCAPSSLLNPLPGGVSSFPCQLSAHSH
jgi:hypothetical protein